MDIVTRRAVRGAAPISPHPSKAELAAQLDAAQAGNLRSAPDMDENIVSFARDLMLVPQTLGEAGNPGAEQHTLDLRVNSTESAGAALDGTYREDSTSQQAATPSGLFVPPLVPNPTPAAPFLGGEAQGAVLPTSSQILIPAGVNLSSLPGSPRRFSRGQSLTRSLTPATRERPTASSSSNLASAAAAAAATEASDGPGGLEDSAAAADADAALAALDGDDSKIPHSSAAGLSSKAASTTGSELLPLQENGPEHGSRPLVATDPHGLATAIAAEAAAESAGAPAATHAAAALPLQAALAAVPAAVQVAAAAGVDSAVDAATLCASPPAEGLLSPTAQASTTAAALTPAAASSKQQQQPQPITPGDAAATAAAQAAGDVTLAAAAAAAGGTQPTDSPAAAVAEGDPGQQQQQQAAEEEHSAHKADSCGVEPKSARADSKPQLLTAANPGNPRFDIIGWG